MLTRKRKRRSREEQVRLAHVAKLFEEELVQKFFDESEFQLWNRWTNTSTPEDREKIFLQVQGIRAFKEFIDQVIVEGKMAQKELEEAEENRINR